MEVRYYCTCYERTLVIKFSSYYDFLKKETELMLDKFYDEWIEGASVEVFDMCLEEYMMERYSETYAIWDEWYVEED